MIKRNYLNNKDILKEIHKSKISYSSYATPDDAHYDLIVPSVEDIRYELEKGRYARADRLTKLAQDAHAASEGKKIKAELVAIDPNTINNHEIVFRVMSWAHIPEAPLSEIKTPKSKKAKAVPFMEEDEDERIHTEYDEDIPEILPPPTPIKYVRVNFPPFQHYKLDANNEIHCVGKSHWIGDLHTGHFSKDHGKMTNTLATMFIKLCERYGTRANWRNYCVDTETEALTQRGWLNIDQIDETDTILSYTKNDLTWSSIKSIYRGQYTGLMHHITSKNVDFLITPQHKLVTARGLVEVELIQQSDQIIVMGNAVAAPVEQIHTDTYVTNTKLSMELLLDLTQSQRELLIQSMIDNTTYYSNDKGQIELFQALVTMSGKKSNCYYVAEPVNSYSVNIYPVTENTTHGVSLDFHGGFDYSTSVDKNQDKTLFPNTPTVPYDGMVWCPETEYGCFVARRNGKVYLTGNTYNDEMRSQALLQLAHVGLQFDESKSSNPFSYCSSIVNNSFLRVLNIEKKNHDIRDDILEMNGLAPSSTRQNSGSNNYDYSSDD